MQANPHSAEIRYSLGLAGSYLAVTNPARVRIASNSIPLVQAVVRHLCYSPFSLAVDHPSIQSALRDSLGVETTITNSEHEPADAALFPFSLQEGVRPAGEKTLVVLAENALSYKSLICPGKVRGTVFSELAGLRGHYRMQPVAGLYTPNFIFWWTLAKALERIDSARYFRFEDRAMNRLIGYGSVARFSYIVVLLGERAVGGTEQGDRTSQIRGLTRD
jgi:hypothetical protein